MRTGKQVDPMHKQNGSLFTFDFALVVLDLSDSLGFKGVMFGLKREIYLCMVVDVFLAVYDPANFERQGERCQAAQAPTRSFTMSCCFVCHRDLRLFCGLFQLYMRTLREFHRVTGERRIL